MNRAIRFVVWFYGSLLGLYPQRFRHEFGDEVLLTFGDVVQDAVAKSGWDLLRVFFKELKDFPGAVISAYVFAMQEDAGGQTMFNLKSEKNWKIETQRAAWIAALPPLIFGFGFALGILIIHEPWQQVPAWRMWLGIGVIVLGAVILGAGALIALWKGIPDWGYSWIGFACMGLVLFIKTWAEEQADMGLYMVSLVVDQLIAIAALSGLVFFLAIAALRGWQQAGLVSLGYAGMMGISLFGMLTAAPVQRLDLALLILPASVLMALLVYFYCVVPDGQRVFILLGVILLYALILWLVLYAWRDWYLVHGGASPMMPLFVIFLILLLSGPIGGILGTPLRRAFRGK